MTKSGRKPSKQEEGDLPAEAKSAFAKVLLEVRAHRVAHDLLETMPDTVKCKFPVEVAPGITHREQLQFLLEATILLMQDDEVAANSFSNIMTHIGTGETESEASDSNAFIRRIFDFIREGAKPSDKRVQECIKSLVALYGLEDGFDASKDPEEDDGDKRNG